MVVPAFPPVEIADEDGLLAIGGDLEIQSLINAYSVGIFPWPISNEYPLAWFSPDPRGVLFFKDLKISRSLKKILKKDYFRVQFNHQFKNVIEACAKAKNRKGQNSTWITKEIIKSYTKFHQQGHAYSIEVYNPSEELVGGIYGVILGHYVSGESMFYKESNASKIALVKLMEFLHQKGVQWIDTQMVTPIVRNLGGKEIARKEFIELLNKSLKLKNDLF